MIWRKRRAGAVLLLLLCLVASYGTASAHSGPHNGSSYPPVRGLVTQVGNKILQVQASAGSVRIALGTGTHVTRVVNGSTADLAGGQSVELQLVTGTSTVKAIVIEPARHAQSSKPSSGGGTFRRGDSRPQSTAEPRSTRTAGRTGRRAGTSHAPAGRNGIVDGQVMSATSRSITIRTERGQTVAYSLSSNVMVTKLVTGHLSDLAIGEMVQVVRSRGGSAADIIILSS